MISNEPEANKVVTLPMCGNTGKFSEGIQNERTKQTKYQTVEPTPLTVM
ncbi:UNVERIFIED_ORG: hypothetical protein J2Y94_002163 [Pseudomonas poae]